MTHCDEITCRFFDKDRWEKALTVGVDKGINLALLRRMATPQALVSLYRDITNRCYRPMPPRVALVPKDLHGNFRTVYVNAPQDRIILAIVNDLLFSLTPDWVHPACKSYISGVGCGKVVIEASQRISTMRLTGEVVGWKGDISKYFDSVPIEFIDQAFDRVEQRYGQSHLIHVVRDYYHSDEYVDRNGNIAHKYMSLRQGCAVSAWLADVLLHHIDERLAQMQGYYVRYSDDMLFVGPDHERAMAVLSEELHKMGLTLNPDKVQPLRPDRWFSFLGFSIRGRQISLSQGRLERFRQVVDRVTRRAHSCQQAVRRVNYALYHGHEDYSWARSVLPVINSKHDIDTLNAYVMDAIRAAHTGHRRIGGLGYNSEGTDGCIVRGKGRHVATNRARMPGRLTGYLSLGCMRNALKTSREAYETLVRQM